MTPERARELAAIYTNSYCSALSISPHVELSDHVREAILQACAEEREACAKIALASPSSAGYDICQIIRGAK